MPVDGITTYQAAVTYIENNPSITSSELQQLVRQMETSTSEATTLLYNNTVVLKNGQEIPVWKVAESLGESSLDAQGANVFKTFNNSDAGKLLNDPLFVSKLESLETAIDYQQIRSGLISDISLNLAETASGSVWTMTGGTRALDAIDTSSDYFQNELPALICDTNVTDFKGGQYGVC